MLPLVGLTKLLESAGFEVAAMPGPGSRWSTATGTRSRSSAPQAAERGISMRILVDFIHVLEYLWKAAWCFCPPRDPAAADWVTAQGLDILHGRVAGVISRIQPGRSVSGQRQAGRERGHIWLIGERAIRPPLGALLSERDEDFGVGGLGG